MSEVFVIRNQLGHYWGKSREWVDGTEPKAVLRVRHEDEAINTLFELSSKDFELRGETLAVPLSEKGEVVVQPSEHLIPKKADDDESLDAAAGEGESAENVESAADEAVEPEVEQPPAALES